jgi:CheY-like chemotaxis protein
MLACEALESLDLDVHSCGCVDEAITVLETMTHLDLVLTDIQMPGRLDGVDLAHLIIYRWPSTAVIVMSAGQRDSGFRLPQSATFLSKPWTVGQLLNAVQKRLTPETNA